MIARAFLACLLALQLGVAPAAAATADECRPKRGTQQLPGAEPWAQKRLDPKRVWPLSTGAGVRVAIIDSGVELNHPQLRLAGRADLTNTGIRDCIGHGTAVAGIIGAVYVEGVPFHGMAPAAQLLSYKQTNTERDGDPDLMVKAIRSAADEGADVINISSATTDFPALRDAVAYALAKDVVIVAAAGNKRAEDGTPIPAYPASYEGVLAVGAAGQSGALSEFSNDKTPVSVLGPGESITSTWPGKAYNLELEGTSYAVPYVAGVVALVRARFPTLDQDQVRRRVIATADLGTGTTTAGMVNPIQAVSAVLPFEPANAPVVAPPPPAPLPPGAVAAVPPVDHAARSLGLIVAGSALGLVLLVAVARALVPMGRRRGWRPGRTD
ncbi:S8 family serine peptidase [Nonomuraea sp. NPDC003214]